MILFCHVISQDHLIEGSCDFIGRTLLFEVKPLPSLVDKDIVVVETMLLVCLMISQVHETITYGNIMGKRT